MESCNSLPEGTRLLETGAAVTALAYSLDERWLAAGTADGKVIPRFAIALTYLLILHDGALRSVEPGLQKP
jgi:hypothetical protein